MVFISCWLSSFIKKNSNHSGGTKLLISLGMLIFLLAFDIALLILSDILAIKIFFDIGLVLLLGTIVITISYVNKKGLLKLK